MNEHERHLVSLLRTALDGDLEKEIKQFEAYYRSLEGDAVPWDSKLGETMHNLADQLEYFEPKAEWRTDPILYDHDELRRRIRQVLALVPSD
jgi:hypothetical protein